MKSLKNNPTVLCTTLLALMYCTHFTYGVSRDIKTADISIVIKMTTPDKAFKVADIRQQTTVTGVVSDENGQPLPGATIQAEGQASVATSDLDGRYSLNVPEGTVNLIFSSLRYKEQTVAIKNRTAIDVQLVRGNNELDEIVVIGYGEQSRVKVVGAVGGIKAETLEAVAAPSFDQQLAGKMSGVIINQSNGQPGASSQIIIRGIGTITAGINPLIVVDGFPLSEGTSLNSINPDDVASIDVLKDAASSAIYGSRGANGVILVTTKKGRKDVPSTITLNVYAGIQQQSSGVKLIDAYDWAQYITEARDWNYVSRDSENRSNADDNPTRIAKGADGRMLSMRDVLQPYLDKQPGLTNTNWMDVAFREALIQNYTLSTSGGNQKVDYYVSMGYFGQQGVIIGTNMERYSANISLNSKIHDRIKVGANIKSTYTVSNLASQASRNDGILGNLSLLFPIFSPYNEDGSLAVSKQTIDQIDDTRYGKKLNGSPGENLLVIAERNKRNYGRFRTFGNVYASLNILDGLDYKLAIGADFDTEDRTIYIPRDVGRYRDAAPRSDAISNERNQKRHNYLIENTLSYKKQLNKHALSGLAGYTFQKEISESLYSAGTGFVDDLVRNISGAASTTASYSKSVWALESYFVRIQYDYDAKYLFSASIRTDGSSRFGKDNRWGVFPSYSVGWVLSKERFFPKNNILTFAKVAASWGGTGNNQIGNYRALSTISGSNYVNGSSLVAGYITTTPANSNLGWETSSSLSIQGTFGLFNDKVNLSVAYYNTFTQDMLLNVPVPRFSGYSSALSNIGKMENQGLEVEFSTADIKLGDFTFGAQANVTTYSNEILALGPDQEQIATGRDQNFITKVGGPLAGIYGYKQIGVFKTQSDLDNTPYAGNSVIGDPILKDFDGDGRITADKDKEYKGKYLPDFTYGFGASVAFKGLKLSFDFMGVAGRTIMDEDLAFIMEANEGFGILTQYAFDNRYHPVNNPSGFLPRSRYALSSTRKVARTSQVVQTNNGDYLRLRNVRISYTLPKGALKKIGISSLQLYLSGNNLITWTKFRGFNVDATKSNPLELGSSSNGNYPIASSILIGIKITY